MSEILQKNKEYAEVMKNVMRLRGEPVAVRLIRKGEAWPEGYTEPESQLSHCQAIFRAKEGVIQAPPEIRELHGRMLSAQHDRHP